MRRTIFVLSVLGLSACAGGSAAPAAAPAAAPTGAGGDYAGATVSAAATILSSDIRRHITFLASDELAGRDTPSPGLEAAATYLVEFLEEAGLDPAGDNGTFLQRFPYTRTAMVTASRRVEYRTVGSTRELDYAQDYYVLPGQLTAEDVEVVFGGPALRPSSGLARVARGKVVLFTVEGDPLGGTGEALLGAFQAAALGQASALVFLLDQNQVRDTIVTMANATNNLI